MKILNVKMLFGMDLLFKYKNIFEQLLKNDKVDIINCSISRDIFFDFRNNYGEEFYNKYYDIMKLILSNNKKINITKDQSYETIDPTTLGNIYSVSINYYICKELINLSNINLPNKYYTISSKIFGIVDRNTWNNRKNYFFEQL